MRSSHLTLGQKLNGFVFHYQELIQVVVVLFGFVLFAAPFLTASGMIPLSFLWTETHGFTRVSGGSILLGALLLVVALLFHNLFETKR